MLHLCVCVRVCMWYVQVLTGLQLAQFIVGIVASSTTYLSDKVNGE